MDATSSQVTKDLFQRFPRLVRKLNAEEARAINNLVNQRVKKEYASLLGVMTFLELSKDNAEQKLHRTLETARKETKKDKDLVREYQRGFGNLSEVLANKEQRFEGKYEQAEKRIAEASEHIQQTEEDNKTLRARIESKDELLEELRQEIESLRIDAMRKSNYTELQVENEKMRKEILRIKFDLDVQRRQNAALLKDLDRLKRGIYVGGPVVPQRKNQTERLADELGGRDVKSQGHLRRSKSSLLLHHRDASWPPSPLPRSRSNEPSRIAGAKKYGNTPGADSGKEKPKGVSNGLARHVGEVISDKGHNPKAYGIDVNDYSRMRQTYRLIDMHSTFEPSLAKEAVKFPYQNQVQPASTNLISRRQVEAGDYINPYKPPLPPSLPNQYGLRCVGDCRARRDLDECRAHLARTCQQNAYLSYALANIRGDSTAATATMMPHRGANNASPLAGINLNVRLKHIGMDSVYTYRERLNRETAQYPDGNLAKKAGVSPPQNLTGPRAPHQQLESTLQTASDFEREPNKAHQGYNTNRRVRKLSRPQGVTYSYKK